MIICDTGPLVAVLNKNDNRHRDCLDLLENHPGRILVPSLVVTEVCYFTESRVGPEGSAQFLESIVNGELEITDPTVLDLRRMIRLVRQYSDLPLGVVDASVVAIAERFKVTEIATLDHRDFGIVRPRHIRAFTLLP